MLFTRYHRNLFLVALVLLGGIFWTLAANKPDPPAPERSLEELMEKLDKGEPAVVEGSVKLPGPFRVLLGPEGVISRTDPETFRIQSASRSLVQLLPDTRLHEYRLTVDLRHDSGNGNSHVGVFFGFRKTSDAPGRAPELGSFHTLTFAERGNLAMVMSSSEKDYQGQCRFSGYFFKQETGSPIYRKRILGRRSTFRFPGPLDEPGKWRRLVLEVRKDRVSGYWIKGEEEKTLIQSFTHPQIGTEIGKIKRALSDKLAGLRNIQTDFLPRAPIGLYVETGIATFRLVKIEPLEKKSP